MNEIYKDKLRVIASDELTVKVLRALFEERLARERPSIVETDNNDLLGQKFRAYEEAKLIIDEAFKDLMENKEFKKLDNSFNKER